MTNLFLWVIYMYIAQGGGVCHMHNNKMVYTTVLCLFFHKFLGWNRSLRQMSSVFHSENEWIMNEQNNAPPSAMQLTRWNLTWAKQLEDSLCLDIALSSDKPVWKCIERRLMETSF